jgi:hypothetical protein
MKNKIKSNDSEKDIPFSYNQYLLSQIENYKDKINKDISYILEKYVDLMVEYIKFISEKINIKKNNYFKFIFIRGYDTISSVFKLMLFYTKNVDLTYYHSQKAFYFYVEFIEQISTDQNSFLQLSSREACLFVYKKTIFEINLEIKKKIKDSSSEEKTILNKLDEIIYTYKNIILFCINHNDSTVVSNISIYLKQHINLSKLLDLSSQQVDCIHLLLNQLVDKKIPITLYFEIISLFVKKINQKKYNYDILKTKILDNEMSNNLTNSKILLDFYFEKL